MTSHQRACSTVLFTYSKDWCSFWIRSLMASASAWTEAFACASTFFFEPCGSVVIWWPFSSGTEIGS